MDIVPEVGRFPGGRPECSGRPLQGTEPLEASYPATVTTVGGGSKSITYPVGWCPPGPESQRR